MFGGKLGVPELLFLFVIFGCCVLPAALTAVGWWKIFSKTGHPGVLSLAMIIPGVGFIVFLWFAFSTWPIEKTQSKSQ
jgi:hypothetical protein